MSKYLYLPGVSGNYAFSTDATPNTTTTFVVEARAKCSDWAAQQAFVSQWAGATNWILRSEPGGALRLYWNGSSAATSSSSTGFSADTLAAVKAELTVGAGDGVVTFYKSTTDTNDFDAMSWTQISTHTGLTIAANNPTAQVQIGCHSSGGNDRLAGNVYRVRFASDGVVQYDADFTDLTKAEVEAASFTEDSSNAATVTLNGAEWAYVSPVTAGVLGRAELLLRASDQYTEGSPQWPDLSGNNHHARWGSAAGSDTNDPLFLPYDGEQYMYLPGSTDNTVRIPDISAYDFATDLNVTAEVWVSFPDITPGNRSELLGKAPGSYSSGWSLYLETSGSLVWRYHDGSNHTCIFAAPGLTANTRHHIAITHDFSGDVVTLYVDGVAHGTPVSPGVTTGFTANTELLSVGGSSGTVAANGSFYSAAISEGVATPAAIAAATVGTPSAAGTVVFDADFTDTNALVEPFATFTEASSNAATVTINRSASGVPSTVVDRAMFVFDGVDDYFDIDDGAWKEFAAAESFTLMVASREHGYAPGMAWLDTTVGYSAASTGWRLYETGTGGSAILEIADGVAETQAIASGLVVNTASVIVAKRDVSVDEIQVFINGVGGTAVTDVTTADLYPSATMTIGHLGTAYHWGQISAVALWREALTDDEIAGLAAELFGGSGGLLLLGVGS